MIIFFKIISIAIKLWKPAKKENKKMKNVLNAKKDFNYLKTNVLQQFKDVKLKIRKNVLNAIVDNS